MSETTPNSEATLWMITATPSSEATEGEKAGGSFQGGLLGNDEDTNEQTATENTGRVAISVSRLQENLNQFLGVVGDLFVRAEQQAEATQTEGETKPGMKLDQIELSVAVNGEGEVGFWGLAKGKVGGATEIKLTFTRKDS